MNKTTHYLLDTLLVPVKSDQEEMFHDLITILGCPDWTGFLAALPRNVVVLRGDAIRCSFQAYLNQEKELV